MLINRKIGQIELDVDEEKPNEIFFEEDFAEKIKGYGIDEIVSEIYLRNGYDHMPLSVFIELTNRCNFSCPFCYINNNDSADSTLPRWDELKEEIDFLISKGMLYCILSGGECLLYPDFKELYLYLKKKGVLVTVFTNGYLLNERFFDLFEQYMPYKIEISIYGIDDVSYKLTTNTKYIDSNRLFDNILELKKRGIYVVCKTPVTSLTEQIYPSIMAWCDEKEVPFYLGYEMIETYSGHSRSQFEASKVLINKLRKEDNEAFWNNESMMRMAFQDEKKKIQFDCSAGRTEIHISADNKILPCMKAFKYKDWKFDISVEGIEKAYTSFTLKLMEKKGAILHDCAGCEHHEVCQECFFTILAEQYEEGNSRYEYCKTLHKFCMNGLIHKNII